VLQTRYLHKDHLGSVVALTDASGAVIERYSYDPWGKRRDATTWASAAPGTFSIDPTYSDRGFTGHEHIDHLGLVNMNGRIYDPELGRFLSADPTTQFPESTQGWNRYGYCGNNPLSYTDPSGYSFLSVLKFVGIAAVSYFTGGLATSWLANVSFSSVLAGTAAGVSAGSIAGGAFFGGFVGGFLGSGGDLRTALLSGVGASPTAGIGSAFGNPSFGAAPTQFLAKAFAHGLVQGGLSSALGGEFASGFFGGFAGSAFEPFADIVESASANPILASAAAAVVGGTVAVIGGGKFANGAASAAFVDLFNRRGHREATGMANRTVSGVCNVDGSETVRSIRNGEIVGTVTIVAGETLRSTDMRDRLLLASEYLGGREITVHSGYRSEKEQALMRAAGNPRAAVRSQHTYGDAADISVEGLDRWQTAYSLGARGYFKRANFYSAGGWSHVDLLEGKVSGFQIDYRRPK
jgi:RHS repeat-associated protein